MQVLILISLFMALRGGGIFLQLNQHDKQKMCVCFKQWQTHIFYRTISTGMVA